MTKRILDLFCGAGGVAMGYHRAGFKVVGVDVDPQPNFPFEFIQADALALSASFIDEFDAIHASPMCQGYCWSTKRWRNNGKVYLDQIPATRELLVASGKPWVIENVPTASLRHPTYLEGTMFGLNVIRRRGFETNWWLPEPMHRERLKPIMQQSKRDPRIFIQKSAYCQVAGSGADGWSCRLRDWQAAMGIDWMSREEIIQAIPPVYTEYIGKYLLGVI